MEATPPMRVLALTARSRFTSEAWPREPRFVRRSVSGEMPTTKEVVVKEVMVRQVPLMLMLSPRWASVRMEAQLEIVREVPAVASWGSRTVTAGLGLGCWWVCGEGREGSGTADCFDYAGEHG